MPVIQRGNLTNDDREYLEKDFDYDYPNNLDLRPTSKLHKKLVDEILSRAEASATVMSARHSSWNKTDQFLTAYKQADDDELDVQSADPRKPISIVFPYSYAILETLMSYMVSAFFREPIFRYEGYGGEDVVGAVLLERVVNLHMNKFKVALNLHTMFRDAFSYGIAPIIPTWRRLSNGNFAGNAAENIDPYLYLPDPNVAATDIQKGEFSAWISPTNYLDLASEEAMDEDTFNVKYLRKMKNRRTTVIVGDPSNRSIKTGVDSRGNNANMDNTTNVVDVISMYIKLIPKEWGLGEKEIPEKWYFRLAADNVIITARSADFNHDKFPITVCAPDFDGYSAAPLSRLEILGGLQGVLDFLFNSHIANVRKAINDMIIYDPMMINSADLKDPRPGKLIRKRRPGWGKGGIKDYIQQLQVNDITRANIGDSTWIVQWMQKIGAVDDAAMGSLRQGGPERLTGAEFEGTQAGAVSRLERIAKVIGLQAMQDLGEFYADHTQQVMDEDMYVKVTGDMSELLLEEYGGQVDRGRLIVSPRDLDINYDVVVRDGSIPGSNFSGVWVKMFEILSKTPELSKHFDIVRIFKHIARNSGAKNVNEFVRRGGTMQSQNMPDEQVAQQVQAGNIVPIQGE